jgi:hypothetical protein
LAERAVFIAVVKKGLGWPVREALSLVAGTLNSVSLASGLYERKVQSTYGFFKTREIVSEKVFWWQIVNRAHSKSVEFRGLRRSIIVEANRVENPDARP